MDGLCPAAVERLLREGETVDGALGNTVRVIQPRRGFRFSVDAVLLARFAAEEPVERAVDLATGSGVVSFCLLALGGAKKVRGIDLQSACVDRAQRSTRLNGWSEEAAFFEVADIREVAGLGRPASTELVVANPPYRTLHDAKVSADPDVALSRFEVALDIGQTAAAAGYLLKKGGSFCVVYPAARLGSLVGSLLREGFTPRVFRSIHPRTDEKASLVLLRAEKGGREGVRIAPPLILHEENGDGEKYGEEARRLLGAPEGGIASRP